MKLYLRRKSGYLSVYSLSMIYPMWKSGVFFQGENAAPIKLQIGGSDSGVPKRVVGVPPWLIRFPSWVDRKIRRRDVGGFVRSPGRPDYVPVWKRDYYVAEDGSRKRRDAATAAATAPPGPSA